MKQKEINIFSGSTLATRGNAHGWVLDVLGIVWSPGDHRDQDIVMLEWEPLTLQDAWHETLRHLHQTRLRNCIPKICLTFLLFSISATRKSYSSLNTLSCSFLRTCMQVFAKNPSLLFGFQSRTWLFRLMVYARHFGRSYDMVWPYDRLTL